MTGVAEAIVDAIVDATDLTAGVDLFIGRLPDQPDTAVCVFEYEGREPEYTMGSGGPVVELPRVQIVSRAAAGVSSYPTARDRCAEIRAAVDQANVSMDGVSMLRVRPLGSVMGVGPDPSDRQVVVCSLEAARIR